MKNALVFSIALSLSCTVTAQAPQGFNYQCIVRDANGVPVKNDTLVLVFDVCTDSSNCIYREKHQAVSNEFGLVNLVVGRDFFYSAGQFSDIDWSTSPKFLKVGIENPGYELLGTSELMSVPYALFAQHAATAGDGGDNWGSQAVQTDSVLTGDGTVDLPLSLAQQGAVPGQVLKWDGTVWIPQNDMDNDNQQLTISGNTIYLTDGGSVVLPAETDGDPANEIQKLDIAGTTLSLSNGGGSVDLPAPNNYAAGMGINITGATPAFTIENTGDIDATDDLTTASQADGDVTGPFSNLQIRGNAVGSDEIAPGVVNTSEIADAAVTAIKLNPMGAKNGEMLKWDTTINLWKPAPDSYWNNSCGTNTVLAIQNRTVGIGQCPDSVVFFHIRNNAQKKIGARLDVEWGFNETRPATGLMVNVDGSISNDGIILYARNAARTSRGMTVNAVKDSAAAKTDTTVALILNAANGDTLNEGIAVAARGGAIAKGVSIEANGGSVDNIGMAIFSGGNTEAISSVNQNYGLYIDLKNRNSNSTKSTPHNKRDIGLFVKAQDAEYDYAAYFDGDVAIPHQLEFINGANLASNDQRWAVYLQPSGTPGTYCNPLSINDLVFAYQSDTDPDDSPRFIIKPNGSYCTVSDRRLKENILSLGNLLPKVLMLNAVSYNLISDTEKNLVPGFLAQEVEPLFPELVQRISGRDGNELLTLNYSGFSVIAIKAIQEQQQMIDTQSEKIENLEKELAELKATVSALLAAKNNKPPSEK